ncbi:MAG: type transport system ATP-binding protein [Myxococcales bacterium]|nr:type transport system ATP-binding protein [Myxococcales bacterium]
MIVPAIRTENLTRRFGRHLGPLALDRLNLSVPEGAFYGFLGANGAGKSTTINILVGLLEPSAGRAFVLGRDVAVEPLEVKRRIGVVPDGLALFERLTAEEHLRFVGRMYGLPAAETERKMRDLLDAMDLGSHARKLVSGFSHGMRKKLALACALIHNPRLLFLDEPFEGVDAVAARGLRELLGDLVRTGNTTVFLTSHVLEIVERLCTHVGIIAKGRIVTSGRLDELRRNHAGAPHSLESLFVSMVGGDRAAAPRPAWLGA